MFCFRPDRLFLCLHQFVCGDTAYGVPDPEFPSGAKGEENIKDWIGEAVELGRFDLDETNAVLDECLNH